MTADDLLSRATELRLDAVHHLTLMAGDVSMCAIGRSGRSFPAAKYHEGRQSAAGQVRRLALDPGGADDEALARLRDQWRRTLADAEAKGRDWVAYATGGIDALDELINPTPPRAVAVLQPPSAQPNRPEM